MAGASHDPRGEVPGPGSDSSVARAEWFRAALRGTLQRLPLAGSGGGLDWNSAPALNMAAVAVRSLSRGVWATFVPVLLPVAGYGAYSLVQTTAAITSQVGILGTPQTLLRQPGRKLPIAGLFLHSLLIACIVFPLLGLRGGVEDRWYAILVAAMAVTFIAYGILVARAKAANGFAGVFHAESIGALTLALALAGVLVFRVGSGNHEMSYVTVASLEIGATLVVVVSLMAGRTTRVTRKELTLVGTGAVLPSVYSVGLLVLLDLLIFRRIEMYFLRASPDGLQGVAVFGLGVQLANLLLLFPTAMVEAWMPGLAAEFAGAWQDFEARLRTNRRTYLRAFFLVVAASILAPPLLVRLVFRHYAPWTLYVTSFAATRVVCSYA